VVPARSHVEDTRARARAREKRKPTHVHGRLNPDEQNRSLVPGALCSACTPRIAHRGAAAAAAAAATLCNLPFPHLSLPPLLPLLLSPLRLPSIPSSSSSSSSSLLSPFPRERSGKDSSSLAIPTLAMPGASRCPWRRRRGLPRGRVTPARLAARIRTELEGSDEPARAKRSEKPIRLREGEDPFVGLVSRGVGGWASGWVGGGLLLVEGPSRLSQRGSERRCSAIVSGGAARSRLELSHAPTSTSIHLPACSASDRFLVWTIRPGCLPPPLPALNPINNAVGSRLRVTARYRADDSPPRVSAVSAVIFASCFSDWTGRSSAAILRVAVRHR